MGNFIFFSLFILLISLFFFRNKAYDKFIKNNNFKKISQETFNIIIIVLIFSFILFILIDTVSNYKDRFKSISDNVDSLKIPVEQKRPHPMFDINTYKDSHEWGK